MATPKQLDFSSPGGGGGGDDSDVISPSLLSLSRGKSHRKLSSKRAASETVPEEERKKKKKKKTKTKENLASPTSNRIWNEEDELAILKGLVDYRAKIGLETKIDWDEFYCFVGGSIVAKVSKKQVLSKIRKLKTKFLVHMEKINEGNDPHFTKSSDSEAFGFSMMIWGKNEAQCANGGGEEMFDVEHLNDNGAAKSDFDGKSHHEAITQNGTAGKKSDEDYELCGVQDAFETMMSQGLSDYQKKLLLENLMNLETGKRRELSNEWKALCVEETKLNIKKFRFSAKLAEAVNDR
ncbi:GLABROUS1 enhancer-binding protein-like 2 [Cardamine amara subsp. amara]|uniref:GLABROUS1 enhancer-binding protein-like 2 n=1 Tax=Cardamine amara subsp. amara TaxID=228776 RepID=A0ABD1AGX0_CARAN